MSHVPRSRSIRSHRAAAASRIRASLSFERAILLLVLGVVTPASAQGTPTPPMSAATPEPTAAPAEVPSAPSGAPTDVPAPPSARAPAPVADPPPPVPVPLRGADEPHGPVIHAGLLEGFQLATEDERQSLRIAGLFSARATAMAFDGEDARFAGNMRLARVALVGNLAGRELTYYFQAEFAGTPSLLDMELAYRPFDELGVRLGRVRVPVGRQWITGLGGLMLPDRSVVSDLFRSGRDTGVTVESSLLGGALELRAGVYGEEGDAWPRSAVRVAFAPLGPFPYSEDVARTAGPTLFMIGLDASYDKRVTAAGGPNADRTTVGMDLALRAGPFAAFAEGYFERRHTGPVATPATPPATTLAAGMFAQAGVFVIPGRMEVYGRYNFYAQDIENAGADGLMRYEAGLSGYWFGSALKLQARYSYNDVTGDPALTAPPNGTPVPQGHVVDVQFILAL